MDVVNELILQAVTSPWLYPVMFATAVIDGKGIASRDAARVETVRMPRPTTSGGRLAGATVAGLAAVIVLLGVGTSVATVAVAVALLLLALRLARPVFREPVPLTRAMVRGWE